MTKVDFYTKVANPQYFACRLVAKVYKQSQRLLVLLPDDGALTMFSARLWSVGDTEFIAHCRADAPEAPDTPIWLSTRADVAGAPEVLLNLSRDLPPQGFARILEIVGNDDDALAVARERFRFYRGQEYQIDHHDMSRSS